MRRERDDWQLNYDMRQADRWHPEGTVRPHVMDRRRPVAGDVIAWERRAWEVMHVRVEEPTDGERESLRHYRPEAQEQRLPYRLTVRRLHGATHPRENDARDVSLRAPANMSERAFEFYESRRVPLCSCCGDPWPCLLAVSEKASAAAGELMERRFARMSPGLCYGCGEVITTRQGKVTMPGDHADFPGHSGPTFHTRGKCAEARRSYERRAGLDQQAAPTLDAGADR